MMKKEQQTLDGNNHYIIMMPILVTSLGCDADVAMTSNPHHTYFWIVELGAIQVLCRVYGSAQISVMKVNAPTSALRGSVQIPEKSVT